MLGDRWRVTDAEVERRYACDGFVTDPTLVAWRGVAVAAPPEQVWPWVTQIRVAPYSYDWVDNLGRRSPRTLLGMPEPVVGEAFTACAGRPVGRVEAVEPGRSLTGFILGAWMTYDVVPTAEGSTRLLLKIVMETSRPVAAVVTLGDLVMARRQLRTWKALAESSPIPRAPA
ncbi:polyketide cyclase [Nocardioides sp. HDW12B]|uniref:polyketide cyclase n=1 Tax=Nocardioides sp. HDW12B TaxID=2714939 RepID=UPI001408628C|nr:polyketide cyclase [Nocardioides sp. HDW12B]QIK67958.1 polyketide cyclase [Nocardioides sp. HDW12B]